ncbi:Glycine cleavage system transcriptional activator [Roseovarius albus]|uniref:Glycine cleavage system transcriptional activator n=1 Tax=Roseovarius albus TaxID=1247867 RepID=A0A1X7A477_9RHOB|nr:LysR family transcriptional regulator [Roseovarius albus]SLN69736.1 Glycine cleavage system transcriptional activator [Roseovarius albus]
MNNPYRLLPPLGALVGFEAAARLGSFSLAAEELNVTQSAISHQIRALESHLGQPLFQRIGRGIELTDAGTDLYNTSADALERVRLGVQRLDAYTKPGTVVVHIPPSLAAGWFMPRLAALKSEAPEIEPWLYTGESYQELADTEYDISFRREPPQLPDEIGQVFLQECRAPLCVPALLEQLEAAPDTVPLIHDEEPDDWRKWYAHAERERENFSAGLNFSDPTFALDAAARGMGVYLGNPELAKPWLKEHKLVQAPGPVLTTKRYIYMVTLDHHLQRPDVRKLWDWLCRHAPLSGDSTSVE